MSDVGVRPSRPQLVAAGLLLVGAVAVAYVYTNRSGEEARAQLGVDLGAVPLGVDAPRVSLLNRAGTAVPLESYRGRLVFVNFWATWCGPCREEMASLVELSRTLDPADVAFVSIAEDDTWPPVDAYLAETPLPFDVYRDQPPRIEGAFETTAYPTSFLIDREGRAVYRFNGARDWNTAAARDLFAAYGARVVAPQR